MTLFQRHPVTVLICVFVALLICILILYQPSYVFHHEFTVTLFSGSVPTTKTTVNSEKNTTNITLDNLYSSSESKYDAVYVNDSREENYVGFNEEYYPEREDEIGEREKSKEEHKIDSWEEYDENVKRKKKKERFKEEEMAYESSSDSEGEGLRSLIPQGLTLPLDEKVTTGLEKERVIKPVNTSMDVQKMAPLPFLTHYRNPCWYEKVNATYSYADNFYTKRGRMSKRGSKAVNFFYTDVEDRLSRGWRLRCVPYFMIVGMPKCGTTDLFFKLTAHQSIVWGASQKEPHWWSRRKYAGLPFTDYVDAFDMAAEEILRNVSWQEDVMYHPKITGEGSASTFWDTRRLWESLTDSQSQPSIHTANLIQSVMPKTRFIVIVRNPTERLFSDYVYFAGTIVTAENFHKRVSFSVKVMWECMRQHTAVFCAHQPSFRRELGKQLCLSEPMGCNTIVPVRLNIGMYSIYFKEWLAVFPREQFYFITLEQYSTNRMQYLDEIVTFLGLEPYLPSISSEIVNSDRMNANTDKPQQMLPETKELLDEFYKPFNQELLNLLKDDMFSFL